MTRRRRKTSTNQSTPNMKRNGSPAAANGNQGRYHNANNNDSSSGVTSGSSSSVANSNRRQYQPRKVRFQFKLSSLFMLDKWKTAVGFVLLGIAIYFSSLGYLMTRINTPFDKVKLVQVNGLNHTDTYWGTYRPFTYFGMKTRDPDSLVMGLMWYNQAEVSATGQGIRHWCDSGDNLRKYGWTYHDGRMFGIQEIQDNSHELVTSFVKYNVNQKYGGDWTARIAVRKSEMSETHEWDRVVSLIWYVALDDYTVGNIKFEMDVISNVPCVSGFTTGVGEFKVCLRPIKGRILHKSFLSAVAFSLSKFKETITSHFRRFQDNYGNSFLGLPGKPESANAPKPNFIAIQITAESDFSVDVTYQSISPMPEHQVPKPLSGREYTTSLMKRVDEFNLRFEQTFHINADNFTQEKIKFAKHALSNMLGGIGYFYGSSRVMSKHTKEPVPYWKAPLYTAVPSRSFFPRGFLWDEGFHGLLISKWDLNIELDIMCHWFDLLNFEGWIPREQILGVEALAKVPDEFVVQHNTNANPPTFFLTLEQILNNKKKDLRNYLNILNSLYPRLQAWFAWYNTTQRGDQIGAYRWRGRDENSIRELNPKTLTSGLDDFPRSSHPDIIERHVDLRCWIAVAAKVMSKLADVLREDSTKYKETYQYLYDNQRLNEQHLSPRTGTYADWGNHTDYVTLERPEMPPIKSKRNGYQEERIVPDSVRVVKKHRNANFTYVDSTFGYVNLFPFLLQILEPDSPHLGKTLDNIRDPNILWTKYGLRSLSKSSPLYMKRNTDHDPPYWRGPIWININYLTLRALYHYKEDIDCPYAKQANEIYKELRENIITNLFKEYQRTGYIFEHYDDTTGRGKGCSPFTGWSSLVVLIMGEQYQ